MLPLVTIVIFITLLLLQMVCQNLFLFLILFLGSIALVPITETGWSVFGIVGSLVLAFGFLMVQPNGSRVLLLFGKYVGTIKKMVSIG